MRSPEHFGPTLMHLSAVDDVDAAVRRYAVCT